MLQPLPMRRNRLSPDIFKITDKLGDIAPYDVIVVGDTPYDAEAAGKLNLRTMVYFVVGSRKKTYARQVVAIYQI